MNTVKQFDLSVAIFAFGWTFEKANSFQEFVDSESRFNVSINWLIICHLSCASKPGTRSWAPGELLLMNGYLHDLSIGLLKIIWIHITWHDVLWCVLMYCDVLWNIERPWLKYVAGSWKVVWHVFHCEVKYSNVIRFVLFSSTHVALLWSVCWLCASSDYLILYLIQLFHLFNSALHPYLLICSSSACSAAGTQSFGFLTNFRLIRPVL